MIYKARVIVIVYVLKITTLKPGLLSLKELFCVPWQAWKIRVFRWFFVIRRCWKKSFFKSEVKYRSSSRYLSFIFHIFVSKSAHNLWTLSNTVYIFLKQNFASSALVAPTLEKPQSKKSPHLFGQGTLSNLLFSRLSTDFKVFPL